MCGINGIVDFRGSVSRNEIKLMNQSLRHRGPDDEGLFLFQNKEYSLGLGHVRLAILDLSPRGHQPMGLSENGKTIYKDNELKNANYVIVFNGEIYNYLELKNKFKLMTETDTDTEIILRLYHLLGPSCVEEFNGMWAFALFDREKNLLFCSRDRLGVKPFYYYWDNKRFIFSSELKGILPVKDINNSSNLNREAIELYFSLGFIPSPYSIFKNVFKLESKKNLVLQLKKKEIETYYYWELPKYYPIYAKDKLICEAKNLLYDAIKIRMRSDAPVGAFLSGGLDSSTVVGVMRKFTDLKKLHTFSIGFKGKYDETPYIKVVIDYFKTNHHHYYFKEGDFENLIDKYSWIYDEPFGDYSGFPTYKVSEMAKEFVTVVLSGDGGDEVFGGYRFHLVSKRIEYLRKFPKFIRKLFLKIFNTNLLKSNILSLIKEAIKLSLIENDEEFYTKLFDGSLVITEEGRKWTEKNLKNCLNKSNGNLFESIRIFDLLFRSLSDNFLVKVDRASMANSLEVRSPFLDYRFAEFSQKIPSDWKVDFFNTKKIMREIVKNILPEEILNRGKRGFEPPLDKWILKEKYKIVLNEGIKILETLNFEDLAGFYKNGVLNKDSKLYNIYKIRLFLFVKWWGKWIR